VNLPSGRGVLFTDTVGFIQKLPTTLIAAFRATLEEVAEADLLLHVVDTPHPNVLQHIEAVEDTLAEIEVPSIPRILVWNKMDLWRSDVMPDSSETDTYFRQVAVSAYRKTGLDALLNAIEDGLSSSLSRATLLLPYDRGDLLSYLFEQSSVISQEHQAEGVRVVVQLPAEIYERFKRYQVKAK
jgi:GTP-binding protein HflX